MTQERGWKRAAESWRACLWLGIGFALLAALSFTSMLFQKSHGFPWFLQAIMLINAVIWFVRARQVFVLKKTALDDASKSVDSL